MDIKTLEEYLASDIVRVWDERHSAWAKSPNLDTFREKDIWFETRFTHILPPVPEPNALHVLDYGCGCGLYSVPLRRRFHYYYGLDTSWAAIALARAHFNNPPNYFGVVSESDRHAGSLLAFADRMLDCVITITVLQHLPVETRLALIAEFKRLLKPDGLYVGLEMMGNTQAADMPPMDEREWVEAWKPMAIERDLPAEHPEWHDNNVWTARWPGSAVTSHGNVAG